MNHPTIPSQVQRDSPTFVSLMFSEGDVYTTDVASAGTSTPASPSPSSSTSRAYAQHIWAHPRSQPRYRPPLLSKGEALLETNRTFRKKYVKCREEYIGEDPIFYYSAPELRAKFLEMRDDCEELPTSTDALRRRVTSAAARAPHRYGAYAHQAGHGGRGISKLNRIYNGL